MNQMNPKHPPDSKADASSSTAAPDHAASPGNTACGGKTGKAVARTIRRADTLTPRFEVVEQLKAARKAQDMTQETLAARVGTKKSNISRFESGKYNPSLDFLIKVASSLGKQLQIKVK